MAEDPKETSQISSDENCSTLKVLSSAVDYVFDVIPPPILLALRVVFGAAFIWVSHLIGYVTQLGVGINGIVGREVSGDLVFEFFTSVVGAAVLTVPLTCLFFQAFNFERIRDARYARWARSSVIYFSSLAFCLSCFFSYIGFINPMMALSYATSTRTAIICSVALILSFVMLFATYKNKRLHSTAMLFCVAGFSYFLGEMKAGEEGYSRQVVIYFDDGSQLPGHLLHRVNHGVLFRKSSYFPFDTGTVFVPYDTIRMIGEPQRESVGAAEILMNDYPSFLSDADLEKKSTLINEP